MERFARAGAWCVAVTGVVVLVGGWVLDLTVLKNIIPGTVAMKASTASALAASAFSLLLLLKPGGSGLGRSAGAALALFPGAVGLAFLSEFAFGWELGIDEFPFRDEAGRAQGIEHPGRLAPTTAVNLVLVSLALLTLEWRPRRGWRLAEALVLPVALVAWMSLIGYTYSIPAFYGPGSAAKMAVNTAACFVVLAGAITLARPHGRLLALATAEAPGRQMARRLAPLVVLLPLILGWLRLEASDAGLVGDRVGTWWLTAATVVAMLLLLWRAAARLDLADAGRRQLEKELFELANRDQMTGLFNRRRFEDELRRHSARVARHGGSTTVMLVDLDALKCANDEFGHAAGDALISGVAAAVAARVRATDVVGRLGGDEFGVLLTEGTAEGARSVGQELVIAIREVRVKGIPEGACSTASIGVAHTTRPPAEDGRALLADADRAMYEAKLFGGNRMAVAPPENDPPGQDARRDRPLAALGSQRG